MPRRIKGVVSYSAGVLMGIISQALGILDYKNLILILDLAIGLIGWGMSGFPMPRLMEIVLRPLQGILQFATTDLPMDSFDQGEILGQILGFVLFFFLLGGGILLARQALRALPSTLRQILPRLKEFMRRSDVIGRIKQFDVTPFVRDPQGAIQDLYANIKRELAAPRKKKQRKQHPRIPRGESRRYLKEWFEQNQNDLRGALGLSPDDKIPHVITVVVDRLTGKVYMGYSGWPKMKSPPEVDAEFLASVQGRYRGSKTNWEKENCGEFLALNKLVTDRKAEYFLSDGRFNQNSVFENVEAYSVVADSRKLGGSRMKPCDNCQELYPGVDWIEG